MAILNHDISGTGAPLVLLHPVGLDRTFWGPLAPRAAASHRVIAVDLPGHGNSAAAAPGRPIGAYADDVIALLDHLQLADATVLGLSFGGMIAQEVSLRAPARVSRLVVGACGARIPASAHSAVIARGTDAVQGGMAAVVEATLTRWFTPAFLGQPVVDDIRRRLLANRPADWAAGWHAIASFDAEARLGSLQMPVLAIAGEHDAGTPVPATQAIATAIPGAEFALLEGAPHMMQIEAADRFTDLVLAFLARTAPAAGR